MPLDPRLPERIIREELHALDRFARPGVHDRPASQAAKFEADVLRWVLGDDPVPPSAKYFDTWGRKPK